MKPLRIGKIAEMKILGELLLTSLNWLSIGRQSQLLDDADNWVEV
jgi:hypothetical protein